MANREGNYQLVRFVEQLWEMHCDPYFGVAETWEDTARCKRWLDAVLPPKEAMPQELKKAAE
jgi:hypothetical protein